MDEPLELLYNKQTRKATIWCFSKPIKSISMTADKLLYEYRFQLCRYAKLLCQYISAHFLGVVFVKPLTGVQPLMDLNALPVLKKRRWGGSWSEVSAVLYANHTFTRVMSLEMQIVSWDTAAPPQLLVIHMFDCPHKLHVGTNNFCWGYTACHSDRWLSLISQSCIFSSSICFRFSRSLGDWIETIRRRWWDCILFLNTYIYWWWFKQWIFFSWHLKECCYYIVTANYFFTSSRLTATNRWIAPPFWSIPLWKKMIIC